MKMKLQIPKVPGRFSLTTRIILGMACVIALTALSSAFIFNTLITNQTREVENQLQKIAVQFQETRRQNPPPANTQNAAVNIEQIKAIVNNPNLSAEAQLAQVRGALRNDGISVVIFQNVLRDAGLPVRGIRDDGPGFKIPRPGTEFSVNFFGQQIESFTTSPLLQSALMGSLLAAIFAVLIGWMLARTIISPLRRLETASERIADGNYSLELPAYGKDDVGRLARSYNKMAQSLRQTEQKRKELVADVAHELRTPLSAIQGYTEVLRDGLVQNKERQNEIHNNILREVRHVTAMVESMRTWLTSERTLENLNVETVPARLPAQMVVERFSQKAAQQEVHLTLYVDDERGDPQVRADSEALTHVLSNLVDNALRYTPADGEIEVRVSAPETLHGYTTKSKVVWYSVRDTGCGIPAEHLPFIFERFYRVDKSRDRLTGGTGLGLAIVRDTIQALGGEVKIESEPGVGTTIRFWLPAASTKPSATPELVAA
jgi:signal transduction histidine kinase